MIPRLLVLTYFPLFFLSTGLGDIAGNMMWRGLVLVPVGLYVAARGLGLLLDGARGARSRVQWGFAGAVVAYTVLYSSLYFPRAFSGAMAIGSLPSITVHALFWHLVYHSTTYRDNVTRFFQDLWLGIFLGFLFGFVNAVASSGWSLRPGAVHDLDRSAAFVRSDLDVPLLAVGLAVWGLAGTVLRRTALGGPEPAGLGSTPLRWLTVLLALAALVMYSRRAPLFALMGAVGVVLLPKRLASRAYYTVLLAPLVPFAWDLAVGLLIQLTQNPVMEAVLARNDVETYLTASNRLATWLRSIAFIENFRWSHLWGYGDVPQYLLPQHLDWLHVHNALMQLFFEAGVITVAVAVALVLGTFRRMKSLMLQKRRLEEVVPLFGFLWAWMVIGAVEPSFRSYTLVHMIFLIIAIAIGNLYAEEMPDAPLRERASVVSHK